MDYIYDLVIVGGGPSGLALSQMCSKLNKKILVIEKENSIGGCHRVRRINVNNEMLFSEHGPRVYSETYIVFQTLLKEMNVDFYDLFTRYKFGITQIGGETIFSILSISELFILTYAFMCLIINENYGNDIILYDYIKNFKESSKEIIDRVCKLTDGGGSDKFTLNEFLQLFNQQFFYNLYQPKYPNDIGLFKIWIDYLQKKNVEFLLNCDINSVNITNNKINFINISVNNTTRTIYGKTFVLAMPPEQLLNVITEFKIPHSLGDLKQFTLDTRYIDYISITFHWDKKLNLKKVYGFPKSKWGVAFTILSDYMNFDQSTSKIMISSAITLTDKKSNNNNKTANECNKVELINEVFNQLKESFGDIPYPTLSIISPGVYYSEKDKKWISKDTAFINSAKQNYIPFECGIIENLYNLGTHNGKSLYKFTSLESAVSNAIYLSNKLYPELNNLAIIKKSTSVTSILNIIILIVIIFLIYSQV